MYLKSFFSLLIFLFTTNSFAAKDCSAEFRAAAKQIPSKLLKMGYKRFGKLDLAELKRKMDTVQVVSGSGLLGANDLHSTARWEVKGFLFKTRKITVDCPWWNKYPEEKALLSLHENLGVLGYYDEIYWISNSLWVLSLPLAHQALTDFELNNMEKMIGEIANASGGIVGVGGGGESASIKYKSARIIQSLKKMRRAKNKKDRDSALADFAYWLEADYNYIESERLDDPWE